MNQNASFRLVACLALSGAVVCGPKLANAQSPEVENASPASLGVMPCNLKFASTNPPTASRVHRCHLR